LLSERGGLRVAEKSVLYIVDRDREFAALLGALLAGEVARVECYERAEAFLERYRPQERALLVLDPTRLEGMSGTELLDALHARGERLPVICLAGRVSMAMSSGVMRAGALDLVQKPFDAGAVVQVLEVLRQAFGQPSREISPALPSSVAEDREGTSFAARFERLTPREREVACLVGEGCSSKAIAARMGLSKRTVDNHRTRVIEKLGVENSVQVARELARNRSQLSNGHARVIGPLSPPHGSSR
jgi:FixJ family two-component response regulator